MEGQGWRERRDEKGREGICKVHFCKVHKPVSVKVHELVAIIETRGLRRQDIGYRVEIGAVKLKGYAFGIRVHLFQKQNCQPDQYFQVVSSAIKPLACCDDSQREGEEARSRWTSSHQCWKKIA